MSTEPNTFVSNPALEGYNVIRETWKRFYNPEKGTFTTPRPKVSGVYGDEGKFNVWSVAVVAQSIMDGAKIYPQELGPLIDPTVKALYKYRSPQYYGYCAVENFQGNEDIYYDDDAQVAFALIGAFEITGNKEYLDRARELVRYLMGGWNKDSKAKNQGGVLWHRDKPYISAISNSECALAALRIARLIPNESKIYIDFGAKAIEWLIKYLLDDDYLVLDGIDKNSDGANGMKWTYNTGVALSAASHLYEYTKDDKWKHHANELAAAATNKNKSLFDRDYGEMDRRYYRDPSYFVQLLFEGFADYLLLVGDKVPESTGNAIRTQLKRHLIYFRKYLYDSNDGLYFQMFQAFQISEDIYKLYTKQFGSSKKFSPNSEERAQEGNGSLESKPLVKTLIGSGSAARIWFQAARVLPELQDD
ncbi:Meiotically up-regulated protein [Wickerhamomyces ciferrii]|uniref:Meiotically up-regulated protein n=1 Tax=Wickerhamomyces ciferrii (strain ATCC 14091 / BCRC 22168 / CBS 111 / JCM 3599 / NBRC 0793 / NRRL Y-1031 F-60-10) TaxID=1206466 RepID=K0KJJ6_WICCF|nr:Meiotically up-regulated protein [Wickerhamomyces ciferrii]CCH45435.1 Meiotically up-regulated protein [Wickerhamomyces ciferrii]